MTISLTTRLSAAFAGGPSQTVTSASFTPSANSTLYVAVFIVASGGDGSLFDIVETSNTGGLTFTRVAQSTHTGGGNGAKMALFEAAVGGSPSAMTVTFDVDSDGAETAYAWVGAFDAVGSAGDVQIVSGQIITKAELESGGNTESHASGTLPSAATNGNTSVLVLGRNNDVDGAAAVPSGWTALFNPTGSYISGVCFHRSDFTGTGVTVTDCGEAVYATCSVLLELEEAGGGGVTGAGAAIAQVGDAAGAGTLSLTGAGTPDATAGVAAGSGTLSLTGAGQAVAQAVVLDGAGTLTVTGTAQTVATVAQADAAGALALTGTGVPTASIGAADGAGTLTLTGAGAALATVATTDGAGNVGSVITGVGAATSSSATTAGTGTLGLTGVGAALASVSDVQAAATLTIFGTGAAVASPGTASGRDVVYPTPDERTYVVPAESRTLTVPAEDRTTTVPADSRTLTVTAA